MLLSNVWRYELREALTLFNKVDLEFIKASELNEVGREK